MLKSSKEKYCYVILDKGYQMLFIADIFSILSNTNLLTFLHNKQLDDFLYVICRHTILAMFTASRFEIINSIFSCIAQAFLFK